QSATTPTPARSAAPAVALTAVPGGTGACRIADVQPLPAGAALFRILPVQSRLRPRTHRRALPVRWAGQPGRRASGRQLDRSRPRPPAGPEQQRPAGTDHAARLRPAGSTAAVAGVQPVHG